MKILFITRKYPPSVGGMQKVNYDLVRELKKTSDVELIALGRAQYHLLWFLPYALFKGIGHRSDIIHIGDGLLAPLGWVLSKIKKKPYTVTVHGLDITYKNRLYRSVVIPYINKANRIICVSENTRKLCLDSGCEVERCSVVPNGVFTGKTNLPDKKEAREQITKRCKVYADELILLAVGRFVKRKGVAWFLKQVQPSLKKTTLIIVGDGPALKEVKESARGLEKVCMLGRVDDKLLQILYRGCDAFIMPNIKVEGDVEGFGIVILEAGSNGLFSFAANIDGIPEAVSDRVNGILLDSGNSQEWIKVLSRFEGRLEELEKMGKQAREYVLETYSWGKIAEKYKRIWLEIVKEPYYR